MLDKLQCYLKQKNQEGLLVPYISDPRTKYASATLSFMTISFILVVASLFTKKIDNSNSFSLFIATSGLYIGRQVTRKGESIEVSQEPTKESKKEE